MELLQRTANLLYHEFILDKWKEEEEEQMSLQAEALFALAIENQGDTSSKPKSKIEWSLMHVLRKNGKGLKPGPSKRKPKSVFDVELVKNESSVFKR